MREEEFVKAVEGAGGTVYLVGGWVRDHLRGAKPRDRDFVITGLERDVFAKLFPAASLIGHAFPVYLVEIDGVRSEVSFARRERKSGHGYRGFAVDFGAEVTIEDDLFRRDTRINSMAYRLPAMELIDPYGGRGDLAHCVIRATSHHFSEDPVRALRAARQAAELGFVIDEGTQVLMADCAAELEEEPTERIVHELSRALAAPQPSLFFEALAHASLLESVFPEIFALKGKTQPPQYHPEGDAYCHTMQIVDVVARKTRTIEARFAALVHDIGKGKTPEEMLPHHYGHEQRGLLVLDAWNERMTLPKSWLMAARFVIKEHMRAPLLKKTGKIADLLLAVEKSGLSFADFRRIICADHGTLPYYLVHGEELLRKMLQVRGTEAPPELRGAAVGKWLREERVRRLAHLLPT
ncbi:HD domain-containing protein [uncultured Selenomonas sp.]|uniref:HD domain-containing protein n=1 Tax=uncultured Selenomonas sp. TaxID=159275 RepID=UPI0028CFE4D0|nr:HD domain-containing protein [uncultured Selenomonas sp.]